MTPGQKFRFKTDPKGADGEVFTIRRVSEFVEMIQIDENGFWCWTDNVEVISGQGS